MNNSQVAHEWAAQTKESAKGSNFYFQGLEIYSYGPHFCAGSLVDVNTRKRVALINCSGYSVTTACHVSNVTKAVSHLETFEVSDPSLNAWNRPNVLQAGFERYKRKALEAFAAAKRSRVYISSRLREAVALRETGNRFLALFRKDFAGKARKIPAFPQDEFEALTEKARLVDAGRDERRRIEREDWVNRALSLADAWLAGDEHGPLWHLPRVLLRAQGENVETSKGARVPLSHARRFYQKITGLRKRCAVNGHDVRVGSFKLDYLKTSGARIGCHFIEWDVMDAFAKAQGWV